MPCFPRRALLLQVALDSSSGVLVPVLPVLCAGLGPWEIFCPLSLCAFRYSWLGHRSPDLTPLLVVMLHCSGKHGSQWRYADGSLWKSPFYCPQEAVSCHCRLLKGSSDIRGLAHRTNRVGGRIGKGLFLQARGDFSRADGRWQVESPICPEK